MKNEKAIKLLIIESTFVEDVDENKGAECVREAYRMAIEALQTDVVRCEDCRHRNTWDNGRLVSQYYRCGKGVKFRGYGYVREDDYCPLGERREE